MTDSLRTYDQALAFARSEHDDPTMEWEGFCQKFVRMSYAIPPLFGSAWAQWLGADDEDRHPGGNPDAAPLGSALCFKGTGPFGHIMLAARPATVKGVPGAWSNDIIVPGAIDYVDRSRPVSKWRQLYLGHLTAVNDHDLQLKTAAPPKPKRRRYRSVALAIERLEEAVLHAVGDGRKRDARALRTELVDLRELYAMLRKA